MAGGGLEQGSLSCRAQARGPRFLEIRIQGIVLSSCLSLPASWASSPPFNHRCHLITWVTDL